MHDVNGRDASCRRLQIGFAVRSACREREGLSYRSIPERSGAVLGVLRGFRRLGRTMHVGGGFAGRAVDELSKEWVGT
jgi:hypothetical protein